MTLAALALSLGVGGVAGVASGLLGIGGGLLMVPFLYFLMGGAEWSGLLVPSEAQAAVAHATSLAVIVPTALSGFLAFRRMGVVPWSTIAPLGVAAAIAALLGARIAIFLPTPLLKAAFGLFLLVTATRLLLATEAGGAPGGDPVPMGRVRALIGGGAVGFLSALLGVGGGLVAVPILLHWARLELRKVVPASIAIILFAAPMGVAVYALSDPQGGALPTGSIGYVYLPAALAMIPGAVLLAPVGARWNQRMGGNALRWTFAALLVLVGTRLVWLHLPQVLAGS